tara:strand:- start:2392 stop:2667 length:276 start_codon:yes stop_codon:yes gene_type:complete
MSFLFNRGKGRGIPRSATFRLTQEGREKLQEFSGDPKSKILMALETRGTSDLDEISEASGMSRGQIERFIKPLVAGQYIQYVSSSMSTEAE